MNITITETELSDGRVGICLKCGETQYGVEPDARRYDCECCGLPEVYGAEEAVLMGRVEVVDG